MPTLEPDYSSPITFEEFWTAIFNGDKSMLPPYWKEGTYMAFEGAIPRYIGRQYIESKRGGLLGRTSDLVIEAFGITGDGTDPKSDDAYFHPGGRSIFLHFQNIGGNAAVRNLTLVWRDDVCPKCEEYRIYMKYNGGKANSPLLNRRIVGPCDEHPHT
jgi:hypothetical protein